MVLVLHICCTVCLIYPLKTIQAKGFKVKGIFYNPNIHPFSEYIRRKETLKSFNDKLNLDIFYPEYKVEDFFREINFNEDRNKRCYLCWKLRLEKTATFTVELGLSMFSTTLLVSPYQDHTTIKKIGEDIAEAKGLKFYYEDFRKGFREANLEAKQQGIYRQNYCGCIYSEIERWKRSGKF